MHTSLFINQSKSFKSHLNFLVDCTWDDWSEWSDCTKSCGNGVKMSNRKIKQEPFFGGRKCEGNDTRFMPCNLELCPGYVNLEIAILTLELFLIGKTSLITRFVRVLMI